MVGIYRIHETGGPDVLRWEDGSLPDPEADQVRVRHTAIGLNYIDTYHRSGLYPLPLPSRLGTEAAGVVEAVGEAVTDLTPGDRVAYAGALGAYANANVLPAGRLVRIPDGVSDEIAAASLLKGLTACYLLTRTYRVGPEHSLLVHAAAGGVGLILCQWARAIGATVIGTVGSAEKAALAEDNGADHTILYREADTVARVRELTGGRGVDVAYDSVGKDTFWTSLDSLAPLGMFVSYGNASGNAPAVEPHELQSRGSLFFTRPTLATYSARTADLRSMADELYGLIGSGTVQVHVNQRYPLSELAQAHRDLENRATTGSTVLLPG
ncbi:MAG: NADPH:quinone reductase [Gammaproteobacteria bacterium]|jgi:NADPH2:quinone reductase|nr:NADPH:quinone reductase [Gammaproteobacteria bacterium]